MYYAATVAFVSMSGFTGLGSAQLLQAVVLLVAACVFFCRNSSHDSMRPRWYRGRFREMWRFSRDSQLIAIAIVSFDPITKAALARFGGLSEIAIFEIASRYVVQVRTLIGAAYSVVVPVIARVSDHGTREVAGIYTRSCVLLVAVSFPLFAGLAVSLPAVSEAVLGRYERMFVVFGGMLTVGWFANALSMPAWSVNIGKRELTLNGMTQAIVLACNAGLAWMLGYLLGGVGVVAGSSAALTIGALFLTITYHRQSGCAFREWFPVHKCLGSARERAGDDPLLDHAPRVGT